MYDYTVSRYAKTLQDIKEAVIGGKEYRFVSDRGYIILDLWYDTLEDAITSATKSVQRTNAGITITDWKGCELARLEISDGVVKVERRGEG